MSHHYRTQSHDLAIADLTVKDVRNLTRVRQRLGLCRSTNEYPYLTWYLDAEEDDMHVPSRQEVIDRINYWCVDRPSRSIPDTDHSVY